jgi:hypothetical protein
VIIPGPKDLGPPLPDVPARRGAQRPRPDAGTTAAPPGAAAGRPFTVRILPPLPAGTRPDTATGNDAPRPRERAAAEEATVSRDS